MKIYILPALTASLSEEQTAFQHWTSDKPNDSGNTPVSWKPRPFCACEREPFLTVTLDAICKLSPFKMQRVSLNKVTAQKAAYRTRLKAYRALGVWRSWIRAGDCVCVCVIVCVCVWVCVCVHFCVFYARLSLSCVWGRSLQMCLCDAIKVKFSPWPQNHHQMREDRMR